MKAVATNPADLKLRPRFALQRKSGTERVWDQHRHGGGAQYDFFPNELGVSLGLRRVQMAGNLRELFAQARGQDATAAAAPATGTKGSSA